MEVRINVEPASVKIRLEEGRAIVSEPEKAEAFFRTVLEVRLGLAAFGVAPGAPVRLQISLWREGLPMDALPQQGWLECAPPETTDWRV
jgi:hypothetical protein